MQAPNSFNNIAIGASRNSYGKIGTTVTLNDAIKRIKHWLPLHVPFSFSSRHLAACSDRRHAFALTNPKHRSGNLQQIEHLDMKNKNRYNILVIAIFSVSRAITINTLSKLAIPLGL